MKSALNENQASRGGAIYSYYEKSKVAINESTLNENIARDGMGGAIYTKKNRAILKKCKMKGNRLDHIYEKD